MNQLITIIDKFAFNPEDNDEIRFQKKLILVVAFACSICGIIWSLMYLILLGKSQTMLSPLLFVIIVGSTIPIAHFKRNHIPLVYAQCLCITWVTAFLQWNIGSLYDSGLVIFWSLLGPIGALLFFRGSKTYIWFAMFIIIVLITVLFQPKLSNDAANISDTGRAIFFLMNLSIPASVIFVTVKYYVNTNDKNLEKVKQTYNKLITSEKLAALGQISAGIAHEVNTPLGAIKSSAEESSKALNEILLDFIWLTKNLSGKEIDYFVDFVVHSNPNSGTLSTFEEREIKKTMKLKFDELGIDNSRFIADRLVQVGIYEVTPKLEHLSKISSFEKLMMITYNILNQQRSNQTIQLAVDKASRIVKALKTYLYNSDEQEAETINLRDNLETVLTIYHNRLKQGIDVIKNYEDVPEVYGHPDQLNQVWTNLIVNSIQAMGNNGLLTIGIKSEGNFVVVSIADNGKGIPFEIQNKIFTPFFTTKISGEGSGLGLDIVKQILNDHGASIFFESKEDIGTIFYVKLPIDKKQ